MKHVAIVGGGASGVLMAAHLLRATRDIRVTLIEKGREPGRGIAYSTEEPSHVLNTRVQNMSAFPDEPGHFAEWLRFRGEAPGDLAFVSRATYGDYLGGLLPGPGTGAGRYQLVARECVAIRPRDLGVELDLADGTVIAAHRAVIAIGHQIPSDPDGLLSDPWTTSPPEDREARVVIIGTGLTMVDRVLSLLDVRHSGEIICLSRRGLLPQPHRITRGVRLSRADIPMGASLAYTTHWLRGLVRTHVAAGGDWRDVVDAIRPHVQEIWRHLPAESRRRFLRHAVTWWDTHRHRMAPASAMRISEATGTGQLKIVRASFEGAKRSKSGLRVAYRAHGDERIRHLAAAQIVDCRGVRRDPRQSATPLPKALVDEGHARIDELGLGLEFSPLSALVAADGKPSERIFGIGPVTRAAFWEITAVPDIREQAARLARHIAGL
jgi:Uncharacterized protein conserved in bacteria